MTPEEMTPEQIQKLKEKLDAPDPAPMMVEHAPVQAVQSSSGPRRSSAFRSSRRFVAGRFAWHDTVFSYREYTDPMRERFMKELDRIHEWLGVSLSQFNSRRAEDVEAMARVPAEKWTEYPRRLEKLYEEALKELLVDWDDPEVEFDPELIPELSCECKTSLFAHISQSSQFGQSQTGFTSGLLNR